MPTCCTEFQLLGILLDFSFIGWLFFIPMMIKLTVDISDIKGTWYVTKSTSQNWNGIVLVLSDR